MTQCHCVQQHNLPFDAVHYQQSIFEQRFPPFQFCSTRPMSPKKRLIMFYDQNCFSKPLMIFSAIHNSSKLFGIFFYVSFASYFLFWNGVTPFLLKIQGVLTKQQKILTLDPFWNFEHLFRLKLQNFEASPPEILRQNQ